MTRSAIDPDLLTDQIAQSSFQGNASLTPNPGQPDDDEGRRADQSQWSEQ